MGNGSPPVGSGGETPVGSLRDEYRRKLKKFADTVESVAVLNSQHCYFNCF